MAELILEPGSKVVHPYYGIGEVEYKEVCSFLGQESVYCSIWYPEIGLRVMVNTSREDDLNKLRAPVSPAVARKVLQYLATSGPKAASKSLWRTRANVQRLKSGDLFQLCDVIKTLTEVSSRVRNFSCKEQALLDQALDLVSAELAYVLGKDLTAMRQEIVALAAGNGVSEQETLRAV